MVNLNLGQDAANKKERKQTAAHIVAKFYHLQQAVRMRRYGSLLINPLGWAKEPITLFWIAQCWPNS